MRNKTTRNNERDLKVTTRDSMVDYKKVTATLILVASVMGCDTSDYSGTSFSRALTEYTARTGNKINETFTTDELELTLTENTTKEF